MASYKVTTLGDSEFIAIPNSFYYTIPLGVSTNYREGYRQQPVKTGVTISYERDGIKAGWGMGTCRGPRL